jgi:hypothetical protein
MFLFRSQLVPHLLLLLLLLVMVGTVLMLPLPRCQPTPDLLLLLLLLLLLVTCGGRQPAFSAMYRQLLLLLQLLLALQCCQSLTHPQLQWKLHKTLDLGPAPGHMCGTLQLQQQHRRQTGQHSALQDSGLLGQPLQLQVLLQQVGVVKGWQRLLGVNQG